LSHSALNGSLSRRIIRVDLEFDSNRLKVAKPAQGGFDCTTCHAPALLRRSDPISEIPLGLGRASDAVESKQAQDRFIPRSNQYPVMHSTNTPSTLGFIEKIGYLWLDFMLRENPRHRPANLRPSLLKSLEQIAGVSGVRRAHYELIVDHDGRRRAPLHIDCAGAHPHYDCG
jgi:hypothetical protein